MKFKVVNPVSVSYLVFTVLIGNFLVVLALIGASFPKLVEVLRYWFAPWTVNLSHAFGFQGEGILGPLFVAACVAALTGFIVRGFSRRPALAVAASIVGVVGVINWFVLAVLSYLAMHLY